MIGSNIPGIGQPIHPMIIVNRAIPSENVLAKPATSFNELKSSRFLSCNVCKSEFNLEHANFNDNFASREMVPKLFNNFLHERDETFKTSCIPHDLIGIYSPT